MQRYRSRVGMRCKWGSVSTVEALMYTVILIFLLCFMYIYCIYTPMYYSHYNVIYNSSTPTFVCGEVGISCMQ